jgi:hypothetical protein
MLAPYFHTESWQKFPLKWPQSCFSFFVSDVAWDSKTTQMTSWEGFPPVSLQDGVNVLKKAL